MSLDCRPEVGSGEVGNAMLLGDAHDDGAELGVVGVMDAWEQVVLDLGVEPAGELGGDPLGGGKGVGLLHLVAAPVDGVVGGLGGGQGGGTRGGGVLGGAGEAGDLVVDDELEGGEEAGGDGGGGGEGE